MYYILCMKGMHTYILHTQLHAYIHYSLSAFSHCSIVSSVIFQLSHNIAKLVSLSHYC